MKVDLRKRQIRNIQNALNNAGFWFEEFVAAGTHKPGDTFKIRGYYRVAEGFKKAVEKAECGRLTKAYEPGKKPK